MTKRWLLFAAVLLTLSAVLSAVSHYVSPIPTNVLVTARWLAILASCFYGLSRRSLTTWILIAMVAGAAIGHDWPQVALNLRVISMIFLRLIKAIVAPLIFATLVSGIAAHSDLKKVGRMGIKAIVYFEVVTTLALVIGLVAINVSRAGAGAKVPAARGEVLEAQKPGGVDTILHIFPENLAKSVADGQILQVVVFSILFGIALAMVRESRRLPVLNFTESLAETMFKFTNTVMYFAPFGVGAAIAYTVGSTGTGILLNLAKLLVTLYVALFVFVGGVLLPVALLAGVPLRRFVAAVAEPVSIAFATANSEAALPRAMEAGRDGRASPSRGVRHADGLQLQPRRKYTLSLPGVYLCCAGSGYPHERGTTIARDADSDADQQGSGRRVSGVPGHSARNGRLVRASDRARFYPARHRSTHGYGANLGQCSGQLSCNRGDRTLGRRLQQTSTHAELNRERWRAALHVILPLVKMQS